MFAKKATIFHELHRKLDDHVSCCLSFESMSFSLHDATITPCWLWRQRRVRLTLSGLDMSLQIPCTVLVFQN